MKRRDLLATAVAVEPGRRGRNLSRVIAVEGRAGRTARVGSSELP
jgi:hypothetical protein